MVEGTVPPILSPLSCRVYSVPAVLSWLSYPAVFSRQFCYGCSVPAVFPDCPIPVPSRLSRPGCPVPDVPSRLSRLGVPALLSWLSGPGCRFPVVSSRLSLPSCLVPAVPSRLSPLGCPLPAVPSRLSPPGCPLPAVPPGCPLLYVMSPMFCPDCPASAFLCYLFRLFAHGCAEPSCPDSPVTVSTLFFRVHQFPYPVSVKTDLFRVTESREFADYQKERVRMYRVGGPGPEQQEGILAPQHPSLQPGARPLPGIVSSSLCQLSKLREIM